MRNELKKRAKEVIEEDYSLKALKGGRKAALARWLVTTHKQEIKRSRGPTIIVKVPNFIFDNIKIEWVPGKDVIDNKVRHLFYVTF